ncbi:hypothetical protein Dsin_005221 [Dipteronia sinensis]|uniref:Uncharacterized protein n=1 Tax=Dipteronia sinensis TaxID=43782 RepID=A0AAD9ZHE8_9ROSI|nr:hypothetical protein Dsin_033209 [Dipteronia sinensis]KAK3225359.1 hypothetical protein Dsin_005221 [Dipteronia sinensis]
MEKRWVKKQPYYIHFKDGRPMVFAALYDSGENSEAIVEQTNTNSFFDLIVIDRMPVILGNKESTNTWLNGPSSSQFDMMLKPYEDSDLGSQPKRLKHEPVTADDTGTQSFVQKGDDDKAKSSAYMLPNEETAKKQTKQGDEELVVDLKSGPDRREKLDMILVKKGNIKDAGGNNQLNCVCAEMKWQSTFVTYLHEHALDLQTL